MVVSVISADLDRWVNIVDFIRSKNSGKSAGNLLSREPDTMSSFVVVRQFSTEHCSAGTRSYLILCTTVRNSHGPDTPPFHKKTSLQNKTKVGSSIRLSSINIDSQKDERAGFKMMIT